MKLQDKHTIVFILVFLMIGLLVYTGKMPKESLMLLITWLIPSPLGKTENTSAEK